MQLKKIKLSYNVLKNINTAANIGKISLTGLCDLFGAFSLDRSKTSSCVD